MSKWLFVSILLLAATPAFAAPLPLDAPPSGWKVRSYRSKLVLVDLAAATLGLAAIMSTDNGGALSPALGYSALGVYAFGGALAHASEGNMGRALLSPAMRIGLPAAGLLLATQYADGCGRDTGDAGILVCTPGFLVFATGGFVLASALDIGLAADYQPIVTVDPSTGQSLAGVVGSF